MPCGEVLSVSIDSILKCKHLILICFIAFLLLKHTAQLAQEGRDELSVLIAQVTQSSTCLSQVMGIEVLVRSEAVLNIVSYFLHSPALIQFILGIVCMHSWSIASPPDSLEQALQRI